MKRDGNNEITIPYIKLIDFKKRENNFCEEIPQGCFIFVFKKVNQFFVSFDLAVVSAEGSTVGSARKVSTPACTES